MSASLIVRLGQALSGYPPRQYHLAKMESNNGALYWAGRVVEGTSICVVNQAGSVVREGVVDSDPEAIAA
jgi:hypothetical protein